MVCLTCAHPDKTFKCYPSDNLYGMSTENIVSNTGDITVWEDVINIFTEIKLLSEEGQYNCFRYDSALLGDFG